jgi:hypothetical protein
MKRKNKIACLSGLICFVYYFFPVVQYEIVYHSNSLNREIIHNDYYIFKVPLELFLFLQYVQGGILPILIQTILFAITWSGMYILGKVFFLKD